MQRVREFDGVRGVLSIIVVTGHINGALVPWFWGCMEVFFCLSGFLIGSIVLEQHDQPKFLKNYFARRALRIWPTYFCALFFVLLFSFALEHGTGMQWSCGSGCIRSFWFLQNVELLATPGIPFSLPRVGYPPFFDHSWSLAIEEQFYLFAPFFCGAIIAILPKPALSFAALIGAALLSLALRFMKFHWWLAPARLDPFMLGILLAMATGMRCKSAACAKALHLLSRRSFLLLSVAPLLFIGVHYDLRPELYDYQYHYLIGVTFFSIFAVSLLAGILAGTNPWINRVLAHPWLQFLGRISYSTYLWHIPVLWYLGVLLPRVPYWPDWLSPPLMFLLVFFVSYVSYLLIERPAESLKKYFPNFPMEKASRRGTDLGNAA